METNILESVATHEFTIKIARQSDVIEAFYISKVVLSHFLKNSIIHPDLFSDTYQNLKQHIDNESLYILKKNDISLGMLTFNENEPDEFKDLVWQNKDQQGFYISRIYVLPHWRNKGIGTQLLLFAEKLAKERGYETVKIDTSSNYEESNLLLLKNKYHFAGNVYFNYQKCPVNCYEKKI